MKSLGQNKLLNWVDLKIGQKVMRDKGFLDGQVVDWVYGWFTNPPSLTYPFQNFLDLIRPCLLGGGVR